MSRKVKDSNAEARVRLVLAFSLFGIVAAYGYVERNPQMSGGAAPGRVETSSVQAANCGRISLMATGNTCGGGVRGISFLSASR